MDGYLYNYLCLISEKNSLIQICIITDIFTRIFIMILDYIPYLTQMLIFIMVVFKWFFFNELTFKKQLL